MAQLAPGVLLVATPLLEDPNFRRTVVLLCAYDEDGAFGLVLNRPIDAAPVVDLLPEWSARVSAPSVLFSGGPVEPRQAFALGRSRALTAERWWTPVTAEVGLLSLDADPASASVEHVRLFAGYAGWSADQLRAEVAEEAWFVLEALPEDVFTRQPERLWQAVLRRQPGELSMFALFPPDPSLN